MTDALNPEHDAVLFALDCACGERIAELAADAIAAAADAVHRALSADAGRVERWTLVVLVDTLFWADDTVGSERALVQREAMAPETARLFARRIAPVLAGAPLDERLPRDVVGIVNAHGVPRSERERLLTLGALAAAAACAHSRTGEAPATLTGVEPANAGRPGARAGLVAAAFDGRGRSESEARALATGRRARLAERHRGVRPWLAAAPDITFTVRARDRHAPPSIVCAPFVVADATPERALGANTYPGPMLELALRIPFPPVGDARA